MFWERIITLLIMLAGAGIFLWREQVADMLPDTLAMRLLLFVGATVALIIQVFRIVRHQHDSKPKKQARNVSTRMRHSLSEINV